MADSYVSEIRMFPFDFAPTGWAFCNGQILPVSQNQALYALIGNTFGGTSPSTFALPNLQGVTPIGVGQTPAPNSASYALGQSGGEAQHVLAIAEIPPHTHALQASTVGGDRTDTTDNYLAPYAQTYGTVADQTTLTSGTVGDAGGQGHQNMQPYLAINFCIALTGPFPPRPR